VVTVTEPYNYDDPSLLLKVNPDRIWSDATGALSKLGQEIEEFLNSALTTMGGTRLSWMGKTSDEVQGFVDKLNTAASNMFGTKGAFNALTNAVATAGNNYAQAEDSNQKMFNDFTASINSPGPQPPPTRDQEQGPITENAPAP
jgi:uncharacterized protein YukE